MSSNVGNYDKGMRIMFGLIFLAATILPFFDKATYVFLGSVLTQVIIFGLLSIYAFLTVFLAFDPLYVPFKINTVGAKPN